MYKRRADHLGEIREQRLLRELLADRLGDAEVDDLDDLLVVVHRHQDVAGLEIAVNDPFLVRVLDGLANGDEELDAICRTGSRFWSQNSVIGMPRTSSITK